MTDITNMDRAKAAALAVKAHGFDPKSEHLQTRIKDLLCNLGHLLMLGCRMSEQDVRDLFDDAMSCLQDELEEQANGLATIVVAD